MPGESATDFVVRDDFSCFGVPQALFNEGGVVGVHVEILIDGFVEDVAAVAVLCVGEFVDSLEFGRWRAEADRFDFWRDHNAINYTVRQHIICA